MGITVLKLSYGEVNRRFYGRKFCDHKTNDLPPLMTVLSTAIPILMLFFTFLPFQVYYFAPTASAYSSIKPDVRKLEATLHNDFEFETVYLAIYCRKFMTLSNQTWCYIPKRIRVVVLYRHIGTYSVFVV